MHWHPVSAAAALCLAATAQAQEIVEVPVSQSGVVLPEDVFGLPPDQWFVARQVTQGDVPCSPDACEAGFTSGDLVISVEHAKQFVRVIAGFRGCPGVAFQEVETGEGSELPEVALDLGQLLGHQVGVGHGVASRRR